jgi:hypothetical protein
MDTFMGRSSTFWVGIEALGVCASGIVVLVTLWFIYRQVRTAAKSFQLDAIRRLQELVDMFREDRTILFKHYPMDVAVSHEQFPKQPPARGKLGAPDDDKRARKGALTSRQTMALQLISEEFRDRGNRVIEKLNDIGQLVEDGFIDKRVFFGKYHVMVIQCCHLIEALRRDEEAKRGGNYGQRLLRMRHRATVYNDIWPKHRAIAIKITREEPSRLAPGSGPVVPEQRVIYQSPDPTLLRRIMWTARRWLSWY